jgi:hypothetical protein
MNWAVHVVNIEEWRGACRILMERTERKIPFGRLSHGWEDNIKVDPQNLREGEMEGVCEYLDELSGCIKYGELID